MSDRERSLIWETLEISATSKAILLNYPAVGEELSADEVNRNLLLVDDQGHVLWQVKPPLPFQPSGDPFVHIEKEGRTLKATRFFGDVCEIDLGNGLATKVGWVK
jgi:hypothetical protein